jgi:hypothetical protein
VTHPSLASKLRYGQKNAVFVKRSSVMLALQVISRVSYSHHVSFVRPFVHVHAFTEPEITLLLSPITNTTRLDERHSHFVGSYLFHKTIYL